MVQIKINDGIIEGELVDNEFGNQYYSFKGIPYAEPPVGDLRFKAPKPIKPWQGIRCAKEFGSASVQQLDFVPEPRPILGSEDCLYLNVYSPDVEPSNPLPVMVWIHGGGFKTGSGDDSLYGPEFIIRHDVLLVTFNYRLGILGFLCLDTEDIPGNAAMKDQVLALKWVKNNINRFGGDPENITIFGESAGGASVGFHVISPMTKGLFKRAIAQSGSPISYWANTLLEPREKALAVARHFGFYSDDDKELYDFFKNIPIEKLVDIDISTTLAQKKYDLQFNVVSEKQFENNEIFFNGSIYEILLNKIHEGVEIMTGYTEDEGILGLALFVMEGNLKDLFKLSNNFLEFFVPKRISIDRPVRDQFEIGRKMRKHYFKNGINSNDNFEGLLKFINFDFFAYEVVAFAKFCSNTKNNKVYLYKFTCKSERNKMTNLFNLNNVFKDRIPVSHADDLMYLFPAKMFQLKIDQSSDSFKFINNVTSLWTNFAKYGNPTPDNSLGIKWLPYNLQDQSYLEIGNQLVAGSSPDKEDIELWDDVFKAHDPRSVIE